MNLIPRALIFVLVTGLCMKAAEYKAGVARLDITPGGPIRMAGYSVREKPSESVAQRLWAKALAIEDRKGSRVVLVTTDLIGLPRNVADAVGAQVAKQYGLERSRLLLNSSHTHAGPIVGSEGRLIGELPDEQRRVVMEYRNLLVEQLTAVVGAALKNLTPADVRFGTGEASFAVNRRVKAATGYVIGVNPNGPVDHRVPVLRFSRPDGSILAIVFGYACHNTTLTAGNLAISGDYASHAQHIVEQEIPGATAMFLMLCGADQNPKPRGAPEHAQAHGTTLGRTVTQVAGRKLDRVSGSLSAAFSIKDLSLAEPFAKPVPYPIQAIRFGKSLTIVALGGEVVVEYARRIEQLFPKSRMVVAGYSNDVMAYIPTTEILKEGGYEPVGSMQYYELPSPFADGVEERVMSGVREVLRRVGLK
jgi:neutral ceramidase